MVNGALNLLRQGRGEVVVHRAEEIDPLAPGQHRAGFQRDLQT